MSRPKGIELSLYSYDLTDEERKECRSWVECKQDKRDCIHFNNAVCKCMILDNTEFKTKDGRAYDCPFYK